VMSASVTRSSSVKFKTIMFFAMGSGTGSSASLRSFDSEFQQDISG
jgi:hypothetical protein